MKRILMQFTVHRKHTLANIVSKHLLVQVQLEGTKEGLILEKSYIPASTVQKRLLIPVTLANMKEFTLEKSLIHANTVQKHLVFHIQL